MPENKLSNKFKDSNSNEQNYWRAYAMASGMTSSVIVGTVCLALYMKNDDSSPWWLAGAIMGGLGAIGSMVDLFMTAGRTSPKNDSHEQQSVSKQIKKEM